MRRPAAAAGLHQLVDHEAGQLLVPVDQLGLLALVDAAAVVGGEPLGPAVEGEVLGGRFPGGKVGVADEDQVGAEALAGQLEGQLLHAHAQAAGHGVLVGSLEGEKDELERLGRQAEEEWPWRLPGSRVGASRRRTAVLAYPRYPRCQPCTFPRHLCYFAMSVRPHKDGKAGKAWRSSICYRKTGSRRRGTTSRPIFPTPPPPPLHPGTLQPAGPDDLAPLFPMGLIMQEMSAEPSDRDPR